MSISDAGKLAKDTVKGVFIGPEPSPKRFGIGGKEEASCETFRAFLTCRGYLSSEKRAVEMPHRAVRSGMQDEHSGVGSVVSGPGRTV